MRKTNFLYWKPADKSAWRPSLFTTLEGEADNRIPVTKPSPLNRYSDDFKAMCILLLRAYPPRNRHRKMAEKLGVPKSTLCDWDMGKHVSQGVLDFVEMKSEEFAKRLDELAQMIAETLPGKVEKAGLKDSVLSIGILVDKSRLLRGEATSITERKSDGQNLLEKLKRINPELIETKAVTQEFIPVRPDHVERKPEQ